MILKTGLWCANVLPIDVPTRPTKTTPSYAFALLRHAVPNVPFCGREVGDLEGALEVVDLNIAPGQDESAFLVALMTAVCRPSLWLAPGLLITAPAISGAANGKGLLVRAINAIAFGVQPRAFTTGTEKHELDKRSCRGAYLEAHQGLFLDNANGIALRSDPLASVLTERPARVRVLGQSRMVSLNSTAFIVHYRQRLERFGGPRSPVYLLRA